MKNDEFILGSSSFVLHPSSLRRGAAAAELAVVLPLLVFLLVMAVDFSRVYYYSLTLSNCARSGALYASDQFSPLAARYSSVQQAAQADAANLRPVPNVSVMYGTSSAGPFSLSSPKLDSNGYPTGYVQVTKLRFFLPSAEEPTKWCKPPGRERRSLLERRSISPAQFS